MCCIRKRRQEMQLYKGDRKVGNEVGGRMRKWWEGFSWVWSSPRRQCKRIYADLLSGREQTSRITLNQGRGRLGRREPGGGTYWKSVGFRIRQSFHFLLGNGKRTDERAGGSVEGGTLRQLCVCGFSQKRLYRGWNWNRASLVKGVQSLASLILTIFFV